MKFHVIDYHIQDEDPDEEDGHGDEHGNGDGHSEKSKFKCDKECVIYMFGRKADKTEESVSMRVTNFKPYFYVRMQRPDMLSFLKQDLKRICSRRYENCWELDTQVHWKTCIYGFQNGKIRPFAKVITSCVASFHHVSKNLGIYEWEYEKVSLFEQYAKQPDDEVYGNENHPLWREIKMLWTNKELAANTIMQFNPKVPYEKRIHRINNEVNHIKNDKMYLPNKWLLYQSNLPPLLSFIHNTEIPAAGMVSCYETKQDYISQTTTDIKLQTTWTNVRASSSQKQASFIEISWDIEANSSDGDFPLPEKNHNYLTNHIISSGVDEDALHHIIDTSHTIVRYKRPMMKKELEFAQKELPKRILPIVESILEYQRARKASKRKADIDERIASERHKMNRILAKYLPPVEGDECIGIGLTLQKFGSGKVYRRIYYALHKTKTRVPSPNEEIVWFEHEKDVILAFTRLVQEVDPDVLVAYNCDGFDWPFLVTRAKELGIESQFLCLSRFRNVPSRYVTDFGNKDLKYVDMIGRVRIDLMRLLQGDVMIKLESYRLDHVVGHFMTEKIIAQDEPCDGYSYWVVESCGELMAGNFITLIGFYYSYSSKLFLGESKKSKFHISEIIKDEDRITLKIKGEYKLPLEECQYVKWCEAKDDLSPAELFEHFRGDKYDRGVIAKYCIQDCELLSRLMNKLDIMVTRLSMATVCLVPMQFVISRGQSIKIFSLLTKYANDEGFLIPVMRADHADPNLHYDGAVVLEPTCGLYTDDYVVVNDFAALYPSCQISDDLSIDTIVLDKRYDNLPGITYNDVKTPIYDTVPAHKGQKPCGKTRHKLPKYDHGFKIVRFANHVNGKKGIMPRILQKILKERKDTRAMIAKEKDPFKKVVLDGRQLALKVVANSLYGFAGYARSQVRCIDLAASVTATGRGNLELAKSTSEEMGGRCVYGDSVPGYTPVFIRNKDDGNTRYIPISMLFCNVASTANQEKEYVVPTSSYQVWSDQGWTDIIHVMRHYTKKKMYRISTQRSFVDVTEDHSLLRPDGTCVAPHDVCVGERIMTSAMPYHNYNDDGVLVSVMLLGTWKDYVYDLETANHHFSAGVGQIVVHNTDSIFVIPPSHIYKGLETEADRMEAAIKWAFHMGEMVTSRLLPPHDLEFEKLIKHLVLFSKKKYVGDYYTDLKKLWYHYINAMGIELKRRDNPPIVKEIMGNVINIFMRTGNVHACKKYVNDGIKKLLSGQVPIDMLVISKTLNSYYKDPESHAHWVLCQRMNARSPGSAPKPGTRVPFVYIVPPKGVKIKLQGDRVESPEYIIENNIPIDYEFYLEALSGCLTRFFSLYYAPNGNYLDKKWKTQLIKDVHEQIFGHHIRECARRNRGQQMISQWTNVKEDDAKYDRMNPYEKLTSKAKYKKPEPPKTQTRKISSFFKPCAN